LAIDTLAGVPSIVFGLFGLAVIVHYVTGKPCILAGSLTLAVLVLPVVIRASEEAIRSVPQTFREASLGLGASSTRCFLTVTFPAAMPGILTGMILAMSRAAGETAPLLFTCAVATGSISNWMNPLMEQTPVLSYSAYDIAVGDRLANMVPYNQFGLVAALIILVLTLNLAAIILRGRIARKLRGG
jgi:phosphate transport system permease protein